MAVVIPNELAQRIKALAEANKRTFNEQLELMVWTFEIMPIQKLSYLPGPAGAHQVPLVEVRGDAIEWGRTWTK